MDQDALGMKVNLASQATLLDGVAAPPKRGTAPKFSAHVYCGQTAGWTKTWYRSRPRPRPHCVRRGPSSPAKGAQLALPLFGPCLLWSWLPIAATAELLFAQLIWVSPVGAVDWFTVNNNSTVMNICIIIQQELRSFWDGWRFGHNRQGPKSGGCSAAFRGELGPRCCISI